MESTSDHPEAKKVRQEVIASERTKTKHKKQKQKSLFPPIPLISREAWTAARTCMKWYEHIDLSHESGSITGTTLCRVPFLAN